MARLMPQVTVWEKLAELAHFNARELAILCKVSLRTLQRQFQEILGCSPQAWLDQQRLLAAQVLLIQGVPIKEVACDLGFKHASHFCRQFKAQAKMTPSQFAASKASREQSPPLDSFGDYCI